MKDVRKKMLDEIDLYVQYAVTKEELPKARELVATYSDNDRVLRLLREYYMVLPEAREEPVCKVSCLMEKEAVCLFVLVCSEHAYLYVVSADELLLLAEYPGEVPAEVLSFFEFKSQKEFEKQCPAQEELEPYAASSDEAACCPACGVADGQEHLLGCVVEICPWCGGTLSKCNCRFEQLKVDEIESEEQLDEFADLLIAKGRIPYSKEQKIAYPGTSDGLDEGSVEEE